MSLKEKAIEELLAAISKVFPGYSWVVVKPKDFVESFLESSGRFRVEFQPAEKKDFAIVVSDEWESHEEWSGYIACLCCETLPPIKTYPPKRDPEELFKNLKKRMGLIFKTVKEFEKLAGIKKEVATKTFRYSDFSLQEAIQNVVDDGFEVIGFKSENFDEMHVIYFLRIVE